MDRFCGKASEVRVKRVVRMGVGTLARDALLVENGDEEGRMDYKRQGKKY